MQVTPPPPPILLPKIWATILFSHKFDGRELFLRYYRTEPRKIAVAENVSPNKMGSSCLQILDPKNGFQVKFQTQNYDTYTPVCKHGKYSLWKIERKIHPFAYNF